MRRPVRLILSLLLLLPVACKDREEREEAERAATARKDAALPKGEARSGDDQLLYALGAILGAKAAGHGFSAAELERVKAGFADAAEGKKLALPEQDLEEWGPRVEALIGRRNNPRLVAEKERGEAFAKASAKEPSAQVLPSGVVVRELVHGNGPAPAASDEVRVKYEGHLIDGTLFDSSAKHGGPAQFRLDKVIRCWTEGVQKMNAGGKARLVCPAATAYGEAGRPPQIPPGATLSFDVELLEVKK